MRLTLWVPGLLSLGLHGFLLSQWPSPLVQLPPWHAEQPMAVTYLPLDPPTPVLDTKPRAVSETRPRIVAETRVRPEAAAPARRPDAAPAPPPERAAKGVPGVLSEAGRPSRRTSQGVMRPIPSVLTPGDFAAFRLKQQLRHRLQQAILYPAAAGPAGRGQARIRVTIGRDGRVCAAAVLAADAALFEAAAMAGIMAVEPLPPLPVEITEETVAYEFLIAFTPGAETTISP